MTSIKSPPPGARVGFTTTIPVEVVLAAGLTPVDLNNLFIADPGARALAAEAEASGFPRTICTWIKGIYAALQHHRRSARSSSPARVIAPIPRPWGRSWRLKAAR